MNKAICIFAVFFLMSIHSISMITQSVNSDANKPLAHTSPLFDLAKEVFGKNYSMVAIPREDIQSGNLAKVTNMIAHYFTEGQTKVTNIVIASFSAEATAKIIRDALTLDAGKQLSQLSIMYIGDSCYSPKVKELTEAAGATYYFRSLKAVTDPQPEESSSLPRKHGITGGLFSTELPVDWDCHNDDGSDPKSYMLKLTNYKSESGSSIIYIEFYADGNDDFNDYADFVRRNTTDIWTNKPIAEAKKIVINGNNALWFVRTKKTFLHPESKSDESIVLKEKFYVLLAKDLKGFFVLTYSSPEAAYEKYLPVFEKVANTFHLL
jgi:hypothetical protein